MNYCPGCGEKLAEDAKFCSNCGYNLEKRSSAQQTAEPNKFLLWASQNKKRLLLAAGALMAVYFIYNYFYSDEKQALNTAQKFFELECKELGCEFGSFYDVETVLKQREDKEMQQHGEYRISGGVVLKNKKGGEDEYYQFGMNIAFYEGKFERAGWPSIERDHEKEEE